MKRVALALAAVVLAVFTVCLVRAVSLTSRQVPAQPAKLDDIDTAAAAARLSKAVQFQTISYEEPGRFDSEAFDQLHRYFAETYPLVHAKLALEWVNNHTAIYRWDGSDPSLKPAILMGHIDVVPVVPGTESRWDQEAFSGAIADGFVWGRGTMDDKGSVVAILEAVETVLRSGGQPKRTVYLVFGHDEELGGPTGAVPAAELLAKRGIQAEFVLDEGGAIVAGQIPGISGPVATVGIAEKGSVSLSVTARAAGGHSSTPPPHTAIGILAEAVTKIENHQLPRGLRGAAAELMEFVAPEMSLPYRMVFANLWLFGPLVESVLGNAVAGNALLRTTTAVTVVHGGVKSNVLPTDAQATVNFRTLPGDTTDVVVNHIKEVVNNPEIEVSPLEGSREASEISPSNSESFRLLQQTVREVFPEVIVAPYLTLGGTDSRHFRTVTSNIFRFSPLLAEPSDLARPHGLNERVSVANYARMIQFYTHFVRGL